MRPIWLELWNVVQTITWCLIFKIQWYLTNWITPTSCYPNIRTHTLLFQLPQTNRTMSPIAYFLFFAFVFFLCFVHRSFLFVVLAVLELVLYTWLASNYRNPLASAYQVLGITSMCQKPQHRYCLSIKHWCHLCCVMYWLLFYVFNTYLLNFMYNSLEGMLVLLIISIQCLMCFNFIIKNNKNFSSNPLME